MAAAAAASRLISSSRATISLTCSAISGSRRTAPAAPSPSARPEVSRLRLASSSSASSATGSRASWKFSRAISRYSVISVSFSQSRVSPASRSRPFPRVISMKESPATTNFFFTIAWESSRMKR